MLKRLLRQNKYPKQSYTLKKLTLILVILIFVIEIKSQIISGEYDSDLKLAFNPISMQLTGFFASFAGYDEATGNSTFSCIFYIKGVYEGKTIAIETFYPKDKESEKVIN